MCGTQGVLALIALCVGLAQSWDIAVSAGDFIEFYTNGTKTDAVRLESKNLTALAYYEAHNMMLYVDKQTDSETICGYFLSFEENICFIKRSGSNIHGLAFDPATELLFFTDTNEKSINWIYLKTITPGSQNDFYGNLLIKMNDRTPTDIAVDSCNGYIYWTNQNTSNLDHIERARLDGSGREVIYQSRFYGFSIAIDQQTQKVYFFEGGKKVKSFASVEFNGQNIKSFTDDFIDQEQLLTVSKDYFYWMNSSVNYKTVWQMAKTANFKGNTKEISKFYNDGRIGIAANYKIREQIEGIQGCEALRSLVPNKIDWLFCVHGTKISGQFVCNCTPGYTGERCDVSVCENYCLHGNCSNKDEGLPNCSCHAGYFGKRCDVNVCLNYCLNDGDCSLNGEDAPVCQCVGNHEGSRCEAVKNYTVTVTNTPTYYSVERNLTQAELLSNWRKPTKKITVTVEV